MVTLSILKSLALGVWLGALLMLGIAVAGPIFQLSPSKTLAGSINGVILGRMNGIEWACAVIAFVASLVLLYLHWADKSRMLHLTQSVMLVVMVALLYYYSQVITPRMHFLRERIGDFDRPKADVEYVTSKEDFDKLHHRYTKLVGANMVLILGAFVVSMLAFRADQLIER